MTSKTKVVTECDTCGQDCLTEDEKETEWRCPECEAQPKLRKHYSLEHADKVLKLVVDMIENEAPERWGGTIDCWANCREQGYHLTGDTGNFNDNPHLVFAQVRNSDGIVVVYGTSKDFCGQTNAPTDEVWEKRREHFSSDAKAARFIINRLLKKD